MWGLRGIRDEGEDGMVSRGRGCLRPTSVYPPLRNRSNGRCESPPPYRGGSCRSRAVLERWSWLSPRQRLNALRVSDAPAEPTDVADRGRGMTTADDDRTGILFPSSRGLGQRQDFGRT